MPLTSCSGEYPLIIRFFRIRTRFGTIFLKCAKVSGDLSAISVIKTMPVMRTPWFFSDKIVRVTGKNISINSGTFLMILKAHNAAFLRIYAFDDLTSFSTSGAKSRAISVDAMDPKVHRANPTTNWVELFKSVLRQFVINK